MSSLSMGSAKSIRILSFKSPKPLAQAPCDERRTSQLPWHFWGFLRPVEEVFCRLRDYWKSKAMNHIIEMLYIFRAGFLDQCFQGALVTRLTNQVIKPLSYRRNFLYLGDHGD